MKPIDDKEFAKLYGKVPIEDVAKKFKIAERTVLRKAKLLGLTRKQKAATVKAEVKRQAAVQIWQDAEIWAQRHLNLHDETMKVLGDLQAIVALAKRKTEQYEQEGRSDMAKFPWLEILRSTQAQYVALLLKLREYEDATVLKEVGIFKEIVMEALKEETPNAFEKVRQRLNGLTQLPILSRLSNAGDRGVYPAPGSEPAESPDRPDGQ
jgi:hypothetical protein